MQLITASSIHDGQKWMPSGTTLAVTDEGIIIDILDTPTEHTIHYDGVLCPGFVNAHCHLELSHMKGVVAEGTGLIPFLKNIPQYRNNYTTEQKQEARHIAFESMLRNGVVAVGDIANTDDTKDLRALGKMHFHTFVEALGFADSGTERSMGYAAATHASFAEQNSNIIQLQQSIVPHAPYSVSRSLFRLISEQRPAAVISIHNQESEEENKYYNNKSGLVNDLLQSLKIDDSSFVATGKPSLASYLPLISARHRLILVHNTYSNAQDVAFAVHYSDNVHWCLCPNANLYIENRLPDIDMLVKAGVNICVGTDSLASNYELNVLGELLTIKKHYPTLSWETLLGWGTKNGAAALQLTDLVGAIEVGKKPGILQLTHLDSSEPIVKRIA
jgi:cytosine/adenosine deaminase-related metal-dependent hydrolase